MTREHNRSTKPLARLKHALWMIEHWAEVEANRCFNAAVGAHKWNLKKRGGRQ